MADFSLKNVQLTAAKVFIAPYDPESLKATNMPAVTLVNPNDNVDNVIGYIESQYTFQRMAGFKNVSLSDILENDITNEVDDCDIGEWSKYSDIIPQFSGDWLTTLDLAALQILLGFNVVSDLGTPVAGATQVLAENTWTHGVAYRLEHQHHDGSGAIIEPSVIAISGSDDGALTEGTHYDVVDNGFGEYAVVFKLSGGKPKLAQDLTITYNYTPVAAEYTGYLIGQTIQPYMIVKVVGCPDAEGKYDTRYIVKASLSGSLDTNFIATGEVPLSAITLRGGKGGYKLVKRERI